MQIPFFKYKLITKGGATFLHRFSFKVGDGSYKIHIILNDDVDDPHVHPWEFISFLAVGAYKEIVDGKLIRHLPFSFVRYDRTKRHKVLLYRAFGLRIPCITIGRYSAKVQPWCEHQKLCDGCKPLGYCADKRYWEQKLYSIGRPRSR